MGVSVSIPTPKNSVAIRNQFIITFYYKKISSKNNYIKKNIYSLNQIYLIEINKNVLNTKL